MLRADKALEKSARGFLFHVSAARCLIDDRGLVSSSPELWQTFSFNVFCIVNVQFFFSSFGRN